MSSQLCLNNQITKPDQCCKTSWSSVIKFANTLRLRLALRISKVEPTKAKTEAESAVSSGVMLTTADDAYMVKSENGGDFNGKSPEWVENWMDGWQPCSTPQNGSIYFSLGWFSIKLTKSKWKSIRLKDHRSLLK